MNLYGKCHRVRELFAIKNAPMFAKEKQMFSLLQVYAVNARPQVTPAAGAPGATTAASAPCTRTALTTSRWCAPASTARSAGTYQQATPYLALSLIHI